MDHEIGQRIKSLRLNKELSQTELADALHISQPTLQRIEQGDSSIWAKYLNDICIYFDVKPEEIVSTKEKNVQINQDNAVVTAQVYNNYMSDKLIEQYKLRLAEKDQLIAELKEKVARLEGGDA